ncbi:MAG: RNA polymerase factor sigma-54, partial [Planctomycetota bacterium]
MEMRQHLDLRMEQKLKLTPQMIQSIEILLLPQLALEERIMNEIETNPVLEIADEGEAVEVAAADGTEAPTAGERFEGNRHDDPDGWGESLKSRRSSGGDEDAPDKMAAIEATAGPPPALADYLLEQLRFVDMDEDVRALVPDLCWALDERGYLTDDLAVLVDEAHLDQAEEAWEHIRSCEPAGIGARDLADCLLLQLARESGDNSFEMRLIRDHFDDVLRNRL